MSPYDEELTLENFMKGLKRRNPGQEEFHQAVEEVAEKLIPFINANPKYKEARILERLVEPDRIMSFRVCWEDDDKNVRVNRGYRVQFSNTIGPYKGGLRFDKSVNLGVLKFLAFEQIFKNSLTTLPIGGAKGGSDFNPKGKSDKEIMRFCQSFMTQLHHYIGEDVDVPAGDIGVGTREVSYLYGQYKRLTNEFTGTITGKGQNFGGSAIRTEATGYGTIYFAREMLKTRGEKLDGKTAVVSGSGNVALYAVEKLLQLGARVLAVSDRGGTLHFSDGITEEQLQALIELKADGQGRLEDFAEGGEFLADEKPWQIPCDMAFPCATENELNDKEAKTLLDNGCTLVCEGANMPTSQKGMQRFQKAKILYAPGKAANAGGVAISGLEMSQNSMRLSWSREEVDQKLQKIMCKIHDKCVEYGGEDGCINYVKGANIGGFVKVADVMLAYGIV